MQEKKATLGQAAAAHLRAAKEIRKVSPSLLPVMVCYCVLAALLPYVTVYFSSRILKELALLRRWEVLWKWVMAGVACTGGFTIGKEIMHQHYAMLFDDFYGRKDMLFSQKLFSLDYADIDRQQTLDLRAQIKQNENWAGWGIAFLPDCLERALQGITGIIGGIALTVTLFTTPVPETAGPLTVLNNPVFLLLLAGVMLLVNYLAGSLSAKAMGYYAALSEEATLGNRYFSHFGFIGYEKNCAADMRIYDQQKLVNTYWKRNFAFSASGKMGKLAQGPIGIYTGLGVGITALFTGFVYVFTCLKAWAGAFDVGSVTQYVGAVTALASNVFTLIELSGRLRANTPYLEKAFAFLDIPNAMYQGSLTTEKRSDRQYQVEFKNVSFKYPGSDTWALKNVSMKFTVGRRLAIVGENGSGKTTFIKLLCRLYDPQEGQILLNGIDIRKYRYDDYINIFSVVFQDFQLLSQPLGANVAGAQAYDRDRVRRALVDAGFGDRLETLPEGLDTMLYQEFTENGVDVSGGEAQKIAIARALYKDAPFIILDEPTAALDPIAEAEIYAKFNDIAGDKTAIYISHRLSSCKFCDEIAVFHEGAVIQQGTHAELAADAQGKYYALWNAQAQYYAKKRRHNL